jgi:membrane associated rhomboid family serine protease/antitoxin component YwqK of YwqJK toxin-antitoxin module
MNFLKTFPATVALIVINTVIFIITYLEAGTLDNPRWTLTLLEMGAEFNPYTLDKQWYRIISHMFLHGHTLHLVLNMVALFFVGKQLETVIGAIKFLWLYFLAGIGSALLSLSWSFFTIGVGASGAVFGLLGFLLVINLIYTHKTGGSIIPILVTFAILAIANIVLGKAFHADHAAHLGGLITGIVLAFITHSSHSDFSKIKWEYLILPLFVLIFLMLPRYQVHYFKFFQQVLKAERSVKEEAGKKLSDEEFAVIFQKNNEQWDTARMMLSGQKYIPEKLQNDTFKLRRYISLHMKENDYKIRLIRDEIYILMDSLDVTRDSMQQFLKLDFPLVFDDPGEPPQDVPEKTAGREMTQVWYDSNWVETNPPGMYYRMGFRDSIQQWQGPVRDYYANGKIQMKGSYKNNKRNGIFLYYTDHDSYSSAGRYIDNRSEGKWQTFYDNGKMKSEVIYRQRSFLKSLWDSAGLQMVKDGRGEFLERYPNGLIKTEGNYRNGEKDGTWIGRHMNGEIHFKEEFSNGILIRGRSQNISGERFIYDGGSLIPRPEGGYEKLKQYLDEEAQRFESPQKGTVKFSFRVTAEGILTDFEFDKSLSPDLDKKAIQIIRDGPVWLPAKLYGYQPIDGYTWVEVNF